LLQLSGAGLALLCDGHSIYGAGTVTQGYAGPATPVFTLQFTHPGTWELWHQEQPLLVVSYGHPQVPTPGFPAVEMRQHLTRLFGSLGPDAHAHYVPWRKPPVPSRMGPRSSSQPGHSKKPRGCTINVSVCNPSP
jgi:hypothetical protein